MMKASFTKDRGMVWPGYISTPQTYIIEGTKAVVVANERPEMMRIGRAVYLNEDYPTADGDGAVSILSNRDQIPYGVLAKSHAITPDGGYQDGDAANVMTLGTIWMIASVTLIPENIHYADRVYVTEDWGSATNDKAGIATNWIFTGKYMRQSFRSIDGTLRSLVEVHCIAPGMSDNVDIEEPSEEVPADWPMYIQGPDGKYYSEGSKLIIPQYGEFKLIANIPEIVKRVKEKHKDGISGNLSIDDIVFANSYYSHAFYSEYPSRFRPQPLDYKSEGPQIFDCYIEYNDLDPEKIVNIMMRVSFSYYHAEEDGGLTQLNGKLNFGNVLVSKTKIED